MHPRLKAMKVRLPRLRRRCRSLRPVSQLNIIRVLGWGVPIYPSLERRALQGMWPDFRVTALRNYSGPLC